MKKNILLNLLFIALLAAAGLFLTGCEELAPVPPGPNELSVPEFSPLSGAYDEGTWINISAAGDQAVYYTLDGTEPTLESTLVTGQILLTEDLTIKAAASYGYELGEVVTADYQALPIISPPVITPYQSSFTEDTVTVTIIAEEGSEIYYTVDQDLDDYQSAVHYSGSFELDVNGGTVRAVAVVDGVASDETIEFYYHLDEYFSDPGFRGRWLGPGGEQKWNISDGRIYIDDNESGSSITDSGTDTVTFSGGTLTLLPDGNTIRYDIDDQYSQYAYYLYRQTGMTASAEITLVDSSGTLSSLEGLEVSVQNMDWEQGYEEHPSGTGPGGVISLTDLVPGDRYRVRVYPDDSGYTVWMTRTVLNDIQGEGYVEDWGTVDIGDFFTDETPEIDFYLKPEYIGRELKADGVTEYPYTLILNNFSDRDLRDAHYTITLPSGISLTDGYDTGSLGTISYNDPEVDFEITCDPFDGEYEDKIVTVRIDSSTTDEYWEQNFPLRFYGTGTDFNINAGADVPGNFYGIAVGPDGYPRLLETGANGCPWQAGEWTVLIGSGGAGLSTPYGLGIEAEEPSDYGSVTPLTGEPNSDFDNILSLTYGDGVVSYLGTYDLDIYHFALSEREVIFQRVISFDANEADNLANGVPESITAWEGGTVTLPGNVTGLEKAGYFFGGWSPQPDPLGVWDSDDVPDTLTAAAGDTTLFAVWLPVISDLAGRTALREDGQLWIPSGTYQSPELLIEDVISVAGYWTDPISSSFVTVAETSGGSFYRSYGTGDFSIMNGAASLEDAITGVNIGFMPSDFAMGGDYPLFEIDGYSPEGFSLALDGSGNVWAYGENGSGQLGLGDNYDKSSYVQAAALSGVTVTAVAAGHSHSLVLDSDGTLYAFGSNSNGQYGIVTGSTSYNTPQTIRTGVTGIYAVDYISFYWDDTGSVWASGVNSSGQLGSDEASPVTESVNIGISGVSIIVSDGRTTFFIKDDGTLWGTGYNEEGQLGVGHRENVYNPRFIMSGVSDVSFDPNYSERRVLILKTDGSLWSCSETPRRLFP